MIPKKSRMTSVRIKKLFLSKGRERIDFDTFFILRKENERFRIGCVFSMKNIAKSTAVFRNRLRRVFYGELSGNTSFPQKGLRGGWNIVVFRGGVLINEGVMRSAAEKTCAYLSRLQKESELNNFINQENKG